MRVGGEGGTAGGSGEADDATHDGEGDEVTYDGGPFVGGLGGLGGPAGGGGGGGGGGLHDDLSIGSTAKTDPGGAAVAAAVAALMVPLPLPMDDESPRDRTLAEMTTADTTQVSRWLDCAWGFLWCGW